MLTLLLIIILISLFILSKIKINNGFISLMNGVLPVMAFILFIMILFNGYDALKLKQVNNDIDFYINENIKIEQEIKNISNNKSQEYFNKNNDFKNLYIKEKLNFYNDNQAELIKLKRTKNELEYSKWLVFF